MQITTKYVGEFPAVTITPLDLAEHLLRELADNSARRATIRLAEWIQRGGDLGAQEIAEIHEAAASGIEWLDGVRERVTAAGMLAEHVEWVEPIDTPAGVWRGPSPSRRTELRARTAPQHLPPEGVATCVFADAIAAVPRWVTTLLDDIGPFHLRASAVTQELTEHAGRWSMIAKQLGWESVRRKRDAEPPPARPRGRPAVEIPKKVRVAYHMVVLQRCGADRSAIRPIIKTEHGVTDTMFDDTWRKKKGLAKRHPLAAG